MKSRSSSVMAGVEDGRSRHPMFQAISQSAFLKIFLIKNGLYNKYIICMTYTIILYCAIFTCILLNPTSLIIVTLEYWPPSDQVQTPPLNVHCTNFICC